LAASFAIDRARHPAVASTTNKFYDYRRVQRAGRMNAVFLGGIMQGNSNEAEWARVAYRPMDRASATAPDMPSCWTSEHVELRLLDAFRIDDRLPKLRGPKQPGDAHPQVAHSTDDIEGQEAIALNPKRFPPNAQEQTLMERVFEWLLFVTDLVLRVALRDWMRVEAKGHSQRAFCLSKGLLLRTFIYQKDAALAQIAARLNSKSVPVF
jgi:hypothetical protein